MAASLILKGVSPGAALVFLLAGPATNITSLTVLLGTLGRRATVIYLGAIAVFAVGFGLLVDGIYGYFGISIQAAIGQAGEVMPYGVQLAAAVLLLVLSIEPVISSIGARLSFILYCFGVNKSCRAEETVHSECTSSSCGCHR